MFIIESYPLAVVCCFLAMLSWGSWANTQKLVGTWRFELFYWDYGFGVLLWSLLVGLTLGSWGHQGRPFLTDLSQSSLQSLGWAFVGGIVFNVGNVMLVAAISLIGLSLAITILVGIALALGVIVNYIASPIGNPVYIFGGVAFILLAIVTGAYISRRMNNAQPSAGQRTGLILSVVGGVLMGFFFRFVAASMTTNFVSPEPGLLTPYSAVFIFSLGLVISNLVVNTYLMRHPFSGAPVYFSDYVKGTGRVHLFGILGGLIWCLGLFFSLLASEKAGAAISYGLGQGATFIAALWGIFVWKEFKGSGPTVSRLLTVMLGFYLLGLSLLVWARVG